MSKYAFIVGACSKYIPEVNALLGSLDFVGSKADVHLWHYNYPQDYIEKLQKADWAYKLILHKIEEPEAREYGGVAEIVCRKRYWYAANIKKDNNESYSAVCVLDADMVFVRDPWQFFEIAEKTGFILGVSKEQNKVYEHEHHKAKGKWVIPKGYYNKVDICNCPLFVDTKVWGDALKKSWTIFTDGFPIDNFKAPDMDALSVCLIEAGSANKTILLPNISWLGVNEKHLKPYIRAVCNRGLIKSECGEPIFSYHGQYFKPKWRKCQLDNRHRCAEGYLGCSFNTDNMAKGAMDLLHSYFKKMLNWKIQIEKKNYVHPELPYEE